MSRKTYKYEVRTYVDKETHDALLAMVARRGESKTEVSRKLLTRALSMEAANDGMDTILSLIREAVRDSMIPTEDRLAKLISKTAIAAATSMYMNTQVIANAGQDAVGIYTESRKKAVSYLRSRKESNIEELGEE